MFVRTVFIFGCGLYIGKYYPQYVPFPPINRTNIKRALNYLETLEKQTK